MRHVLPLWQKRDSSLMCKLRLARSRQCSTRLAHGCDASSVSDAMQKLIGVTAAAERADAMSGRSEH